MHNPHAKPQVAKRKLSIAKRALQFTAELLKIGTPKRTLLVSVMDQHNVDARTARAMLRKMRSSKRRTRHGGGGTQHADHD